MRTLKVGDRVKINRNVNREAYRDISYPSSMAYHMGSISTVTNIRRCSWHPHGYLYDLSNNWTYIEEWITPIEDLTLYDLTD